MKTGKATTIQGDLDFSLEYEVTKIERRSLNLTRDTDCRSIGQFLDGMIHDAMVDNQSLDRVSFDLRPYFAMAAMNAKSGYNPSE